MKIKNTKDLKHYFGRFMFYGDHDTFKTRTAASFPKPLFLSSGTEGGILSVRDKAVDYATVDHPSDVMDAIDELYEQWDSGKLKHKTLVVDSLSILQETQIDQLLENRAAHEQKKRKEKGRVDWRVRRAEQVLNLADADWGVITSTLRSLFINAHGLPMHVIWIALCDRHFGKINEWDREETLLSATPMIYTKKAARKMSAIVDFLWYFEVVEIQNKKPMRRIHTTTYQGYNARSREKLPAILKPDYKLFAKKLGLKKLKKKKKA